MTTVIDNTDQEQILKTISYRDFTAQLKQCLFSNGTETIYGYKYLFYTNGSNEPIRFISLQKSITFFDGLTQHFNKIFTKNTPTEIMALITTSKTLSEIYFSENIKDKAENFLKEHKNETFNENMIIQYIHYSFNYINSPELHNIIQHYNNSFKTNLKGITKSNYMQDAALSSAYKLLCPALYSYTFDQITFFNEIKEKYGIINLQAAELMYKINTLLFTNNSKTLSTLVKDCTIKESHKHYCDHDYNPHYPTNKMDSDNGELLTKGHIDFLNYDFDNFYELLSNDTISTSLHIQEYIFKPYYRNILDNDFYDFIEHIIFNGTALNLNTHKELRFNYTKDYIDYITRPLGISNDEIQQKKATLKYILRPISEIYNNYYNDTVQNNKISENKINYYLYNNLIIKYINSMINDHNYSAELFCETVTKIGRIQETMYFINYENIYKLLRKMNINEFMEFIEQLHEMIEQNESLHDYTESLSYSLHRRKIEFANKISIDYADNYKDYKNMPLSWWLEFIQ